MEKARGQKTVIIFALILALVSLSVGFAAFSVSLNIASNASVSPSSDTFSVKFSTNQNSLVGGSVTPSSKTNGITASNGVINNLSNPTITTLSATFTEPGQYVEYTFYARNEGEYTAYLNNINYVGNKTCMAEQGTTAALVQSACEYINISAMIGETTYNETTQITGHTLAKGSGEQIKVRLEYVSNGVQTDGPFSITFPNIALVYSTIDDSTIQPTIPIVRVVRGALDAVGSEICIAEECFYVISSTEDTVTMLAKYNLHVVFYYNGTSWTSLSNPTGIQDSSSRARARFSNNSNQYSGSLAEEYVNNYKTEIEKNELEVTEARLITTEELEKLGCNCTFTIWETGSCSEAPSWVYSTSYWTKTIYHTGLVNVRYDSAKVGWIGYNNFDTAGIRPVITISKSEF